MRSPPAAPTGAAIALWRPKLLSSVRVVNRLVAKHLDVNWHTVNKHVAKIREHFRNLGLDESLSKS
jgi:hypothetical protein